MKIGYFADGPWAHRVFERLIADPKFEIAMIVPRFDVRDPVLKSYAEKHGIPFLLFEDVNADAAIRELEKYDCDIFVSMSYNQILRQKICALTPKGFINCHAGALPFYRGRNILNWALINGETKVGITVHYVDEGIDTGDIIVQDFIPVEAEDNYRTLLTKCYEQCAETLLKALVALEDGTASRTEQSTIDPVGFYCTRRLPGDEILSWQWTSLQLHNFVRGVCPPGPGARFTYKDATWAVTESELISGAPNYICIPGAVVGRAADGNVIKTGDSTLKIKKVALVGQDGLLQKEIVPQFPIGARL